MTPAINSPAGQNSTPATPPQPTIDKANGRSSRASPEKAGKAEGGSSKGNASVALGDTSSDSESEYSKNKTGNSGAVGSSRDGGAGKGAGDEFGGSDDDEEDLDLCGICSEPAERPVSSACGHSFCRTWWVNSYLPLFFTVFFCRVGFKLPCPLVIFLIFILASRFPALPSTFSFSLYSVMSEAY